VSRDEQSERFDARREDPLKRWKLSPMDAEAQSRWDEYSDARDVMMVHSDSVLAPWTIINPNEKKRARLELILTGIRGCSMGWFSPAASV